MSNKQIKKIVFVLGFSALTLGLTACGKKEGVSICNKAFDDVLEQYSKTGTKEQLTQLKKDIEDEKKSWELYSDTDADQAVLAQKCRDQAKMYQYLRMQNNITNSIK